MPPNEDYTRVAEIQIKRGRAGNPKVAGLNPGLEVFNPDRVTPMTKIDICCFLARR